jgi:hypothetical protein
MSVTNTWSARVERRAELGRQRARARIAVRLEDRRHAPAPELRGRVERGLDLVG